MKCKKSWMNIYVMEIRNDTEAKEMHEYLKEFLNKLQEKKRFLLVTKKC